MAEDRVITFIQFACKAGELISGAEASIAAIKAKKAKLVLLSGDTAKNTVEQFFALAERAQIPCHVLDENDAGAYIGHPERKIMCVIGNMFADTILKEINLKAGTKNE